MRNGQQEVDVFAMNWVLLDYALEFGDRLLVLVLSEVSDA